MIKELEPNVSCSENGECVDAIDWTPDLKFERFFFFGQWNFWVNCNRYNKWNIKCVLISNRSQLFDNS